MNIQTNDKIKAFIALGSLLWFVADIFTNWEITCIRNNEEIQCQLKDFYVVEEIEMLNKC